MSKAFTAAVTGAQKSAAVRPWKFALKGAGMKHFLRLRDLGHAGLLEILDRAQERAGGAETRAGMRGAEPLLLFSEQAPQERLALTASIRAAGGNEVYFGPGEWRSDPLSLSSSSFCYGESSRICAVHGLDQNALALLSASCGCRVMNCGGAGGHPCLALADLAFMRESRPDLSAVRIAWVGGSCGLAHSLIEAAMLLPVELFMALPEWGEPDRELLGLAFAAGAKIFLTRDIHMAVDGAHYVYAGAGPEQSGDRVLHAGMMLDAQALAPADPQVKLLLGLESGCRVQEEMLELHAATARRRFAVRLRVQRLLWEWIAAEDAGADTENVSA